MKTTRFEFTEEQVVTMIITALGVLKDRIGQKGRWQQRRRLPTLRSRLADCITIGDDLEADGVRRALVRTTKDIESKIARGKRIAALMDAIKLQVGGVADRRLREFDDFDGDGDGE